MTRSIPVEALTIVASATRITEVEGDAALVREVLEQRSDLAFRELYQRHTGRLYRIAKRMMTSDADAEDAVQETWLRAMLLVAGFEWRSQFGTWLAGITINIAREQLRRQGRWQMVELNDREIAPTIEAIDGDIERAIASLPPGARTAFVLHDIEGFTHEEIAQQLGWVAGTSKTQLFRARRALRLALGNDSTEGAR